MSIRCWAAWTLALSCGALSFVEAPRACADESLLERAVVRQLERMSRSTGDALWDETARLDALGEAAVPFVEARIDALAEPLVRLAAARFLARAGKVDRACAVWLTLAEPGNDRAVRLAALELLELSAPPATLARLEPALATERDPRFSVAIARVLARREPAARAVDRLAELLESHDLEAAAEAALALGGLGYVADAHEPLERLAREPGPRGRLARAYLDRAREDESRRKGAVLLAEVVDRIRRHHVDGDRRSSGELEELAVRGLVRSIDPHSSFWNAQEYAQFVQDLSGRYAGIGAYVGIRAGVLTILAPIYSGPAYRAGVRSRDQLIEVDGWPTEDHTIDEALEHVLGEPGTSVRLKLYREGWALPRELNVVRAEIDVPSVRSAPLGAGLGYVRLDQFGETTPREMRAALARLKTGGLRGLVLDLRGNGGGYLAAAVDIAGEFLPKGAFIVASAGLDPDLAPRREYYARVDGPQVALPLVVLVDGETASAAEILSGALALHRRAVLVGERTYGKGTVQLPIELDCQPGARLKLTVARYYLLGERSIDATRDSEGRVLDPGGILPDHVVHPAVIPGWVDERFAELREAGALGRYFATLTPADRVRVAELSRADQGDASRWPQFDAWLGTLGEPMPREFARAWLRGAAREREADAAGAEFSCDLGEDLQLQRAVLELCAGPLAIDPASVEAFRGFAAKR